MPLKYVLKLTYTKIFSFKFNTLNETTFEAILFWPKNDLKF